MPPAARSLRTFWLIAVPSLVLAAYLGYSVPQNDFTGLIVGYLPWFGLYIFALQNAEAARHWRWFVGLGILLRLLLVFAPPLLSDDVYRFIWDGRLLLAGHNPFDQLPGYYLEPGNAVPGLTRALYDSLNSPGYFTIYPPAAQAVFAFAVWLFPQSISGSTLVMKGVLFLAECGTLLLLPRLLRRWELPPSRVLVYALNPLIILEITGNLHFEGLLIFFLVLSFRLLARGWLVGAALAFAGSVVAKLLPVLFLPLLWRRLGTRQAWLFYGLVGIAVLLAFAPLLSGFFLTNFSNSLDLYFRKFEFNAGVYTAIRWIGYRVKGYNIIGSLGPALALCTLVGIAALSLLERRPTLRDWPRACLWAICLYLLFTTTVHPWYVSLPILLCGFTRYRFPVLWSGLIMLTYLQYAGGSFRELPWIMVLEYGVVFAYAAWEIRSARR